MKYTNTVKLQKTGSHKNNKGITLIESMVAVVIVAIGFLSVYQLTSYAINSIDASIDRNKLNFLSEMMAEDMMADPVNIQNYQYSRTCNYNQSSSGNERFNERINSWNKMFKNNLGDTSASCKSNDTKDINVNGTNQIQARINLKHKNGKQRKYLGVIIKK